MGNRRRRGPTTPGAPRASRPPAGRPRRGCSRRRGGARRCGPRGARRPRRPPRGTWRATTRTRRTPGGGPRCARVVDAASLFEATALPPPPGRGLSTALPSMYGGPPPRATCSRVEASSPSSLDNPGQDPNRPKEKGSKMATNEMDSHVKEIAKALGNRVPEQEIARELENYVSVYRVSVDTAKRSIVKKHGGDPAGLLKAAGKTVQELRAGDNAVNLLARVVYVDRRTVNVPDGAKEILSGILGDNSGTVPFTAWEASGLELAKGDVIRIANAYTKEYRGRVEVPLGGRAVITREPPEALPFQPRAPATGGAPVAAKVS